MFRRMSAKGGCPRERRLPAGADEKFHLAANDGSTLNLIALSVPAGSRCSKGGR
jgi:hypothetical protein